MYIKEITTEFLMYGGDSFRTLNLIDTPTNVRLELTDDWRSIQLHLTSTDDKYKIWLLHHAGSLILLGRQQWFSPKYHDEFQVVLARLVELFKTIE